MADPVVNGGYDSLRREIARLLQEGKGRARRAVEVETLRTYHGIGRWLYEHVPAHRDRAGYGEQVPVRLAGDVGISKTLLYESLAFYRFNPIFQACGKLG